MAKEITREELKESLRHYWRMRKCIKNTVNKYNGMSKQSIYSTLINAINETWKSKYCILCAYYANTGDIRFICGSCPLDLANNNCNHHSSAWHQVNIKGTEGYTKENLIKFINACTEMARVIMKLPRDNK